MGAFQTSDCNTHGYYIVKWTGNAYNLQGKYKFHAFDPPVIIPEGELVCPAKFMTPMRKTSYWNNKTDKATPLMVKLNSFYAFYRIDSGQQYKKVVAITF